MRLWLLPLAPMIAFMFGCNQSPEGGVPDTPQSFRLSLPTGTKDIRQGTAETYRGSINRGSEFKHDVKLTVNKPQNVEVKLSKDVIKANEDTNFDIIVTAAKEAALAEHVITVTGTPEGGGQPTTGDFRIRVTENQ